MTIQIELLDADGLVTLERTFQQSHVGVGGDECDDFVVSGLPARSLVVIESESRGAVDAGGTRTMLVPNEVTVFHLGTRRLRICVFARVHAAHGACPRCGGVITERTSGAGYRTMVSRERECGACGAAVLELADAERSIGEFSERPETEWLMVAAPMGCPQCAAVLTRTMLRTEHGRAEVERCEACSLVVLEKKDRVVLAG